MYYSQVCYAAAELDVGFFLLRTVPKVYRKMKGSEHKNRKVFGVPLLQSVQRSGKPLPPSILRAMEYLKTECLDQVRSS